MELKKIIIHNLTNLPTKKYTEFKDLQEDFKEDNPEANKKLQQRIIEVGFKYPFCVWIDNNNNFWTVDAHQRKKALIELKTQGYEIPEIPYIEIFAKNKTDAKKEILYLNSRYAAINPNSNFVLDNFKIDIDFNIEIPEIEIDLGKLDNVNDDDYQIPKEIKTNIKYGDLFTIKFCNQKHRIMCGDALKKEDIDKLMNFEKADIVFTDPPYELENAEIYNNINHIAKNTNILIFASDKQIPFVFSALNCNFKRLYTIDTGIASPTNNDVYVNHIALLRFKKGNASKFNNIHNGGRSIVKTKYRKNLKEGYYHKHQKSIETLGLFIRYWSNKNELIVDLFGGSGSLLIAAQQLSRNCYINELEPKNCQIIINRFKENYPNCIIKPI